MSRVPVWHSLAEVPAALGPTAVTIGNFDGVHRGHRAVLAQLARQAEARALAPVALTFWPHPRHVCHTPGIPPLLTSQGERDRLVALSGVRGVLDLPFTWEFAQLSPEDFVREVLVEGLRMRCIVLGEDTRFGRANAGDLATMRALGAEHGFDVVTVCELGPDGEEVEPGQGLRVSSSAVREAVLRGDIEEATRMLGRYPSVTDVVHHGFKRGRELGFPTANLGPAPEGLVPEDGVYAGYLTVIEQVPEHRGTPPLVGAPATISIGTNPTFAPEDGGPAPRMVEAYVHGSHQLDLYGDRVRIELVRRQRPTLRFDSVQELVDQMCRDADVTRRTLAEKPLGAPALD